MSPSINSKAAVSDRSKKIAAPLDHLAISESLGYHIFRKKKRRSWKDEEDEQLKQAVIDHYLDQNGLTEFHNEDIKPDEIKWDVISKLFDDRKPKDCRKRWVGSLNPALRKGKWTKQEDAQLIEAHSRYGTAWHQVAALIHGRNEDQCSKRYTEVLRAGTQDRLRPWQLSEDLKLIHGVAANGTKWRTISQNMPGRPSLTCRNRWRRIVNDVAKGNASPEIMKAVGVVDHNGNKLFTFDNNGKVEKFSNARGPSTPPVFNSYASSPASSSGDSINTMTIVNNNKIPTLTKTFTDWRFSLTDPRTNREISEFSGNIETPELAHRLIELAKCNGVGLTIHQHIHHHYSQAASSPVVDPQASVTRYSHFNYLPPLTEVPKLHSSSPGASGQDNESPRAPSLLNLLNEERALSPQKCNPQTPNLSINGLDRQQTSQGTAGSSAVKGKSNINDFDALEEEMDFWETLQSITQPKPDTTAAPVSQHHPLHYAQAANSCAYPAGSFATNQPVQSNNNNAKNNKDNNAKPRYTADDALEEPYYVPLDSDPRSGSGTSEGSNSLGYMMPFNPS